MDILGIDIGGTGIKGAPVNTETGELLAERFRLPTPPGALPADVGATVAQVVEHFHWQGPIGCGFPAVVRNGQVLTAANVSKTWIGQDAIQLFTQATGCPVVVINDADAAGYAEMCFGAGKDYPGVVLIATLGTGIGTALFVDGNLVPNTELGHIEVRGKDAEKRAAASVRERKKLTWKRWAKHVNEYLCHLEFYLRPDLIILGGGVSSKADKFLPLLHLDTEVVAAQMHNEAGIVGAALAAASHPHAGAQAAPPAPAPPMATDTPAGPTSTSQDGISDPMRDAHEVHEPLP
jgi:polyphosphate glucokinase